jgi:hypothetical protein
MNDLNCQSSGDLTNEWICDGSGDLVSLSAWYLENVRCFIFDVENTKLLLHQLYCIML